MDIYIYISIKHLFMSFKFSLSLDLDHFVIDIAFTTHHYIADHSSALSAEELILCPPSHCTTADRKPPYITNISHGKVLDSLHH